MIRSTWNRFWRLGALCAAIGAAAPTWAVGPLAAVEVLRDGGCGGTMPAARPLRRNPFLDRAAVEWALGRSLPMASVENGFPGNVTAGVHISGPESAVLQQLRQVGCRIVAGREMRDVGLYRRGPDTWIVVASIYPLPPGMTASTGTWKPGAPLPAPGPVQSWNSPPRGWRSPGPPLPPASGGMHPPPDESARVMPAPSDDSARAVPAPPAVARAVPPSGVPAIAAAPARRAGEKPTLAASSNLANRALELVNQVRARGTHCGDELFGPAPALTLSGTLDDVALGHANDMAQKNYFEHVDPAGHSPADRVRATGYQEKLVGENIAYGPKTVDEVVQGWLDSPGHCENIMDPRFAEMGLALAPGRVKHGLYWVQLFAEPRAQKLAAAR